MPRSSWFMDDTLPHHSSRMIESRNRMGPPLNRKDWGPQNQCSKWCAPLVTLKKNVMGITFLSIGDPHHLQWLHSKFHNQMAKNKRRRSSSIRTLPRIFKSTGPHLNSQVLDPTRPAPCLQAFLTRFASCQESLTTYQMLLLPKLILPMWS